MYSFIEKIGILILVAFSQPTYSSPYIRRQVSAPSCDGDTKAFALGLQNIISTQTQEITTTTKMISTISSANFDQGVFGVQQSQLVTQIKESISVIQISQNIQIGNNLISASLTKMTQMQTTQLSLVQQLGSSNINPDIAMQSLNELSVSLKSCMQQSQQVLQQTLSICPGISGIVNNQLPSNAPDSNLSNVADSASNKALDSNSSDITDSNSSNAIIDKDSNNTDDKKKDDNKKDGNKDDSKNDGNKKNDEKI
ncbi:hypothetical protein GcC1_127020 [Golovinomyces cichoracearum]|uniref:Cell wall protein n=1 Tax=Golovinomyces cichoracearum TaxID=62708 RepID=A0A420I5L1_9PEZI|nr:hypothetical protein GcC1_127020 [Golovinomyces cichoracearum]